MKTPKEITNNLKKGIVTENMLALCLYSFNKRAKNYRDQKNKLYRFYKNNRFYYDRYDNIEKNEANLLM